MSFDPIEFCARKLRLVWLYLFGRRIYVAYLPLSEHGETLATHFKEISSSKPNAYYPEGYDLNMYEVPCEVLSSAVLNKDMVGKALGNGDLLVLTFWSRGLVRAERVQRWVI